MWGGYNTSAVAVFARNTDGKLNFVEVLRDGLNGGVLTAVVVSSDGQHVYVGGSNIVVFARNPNDGKLTFVEVLKNGDKQGPLTIDGLDWAESVMVSPDNQHVYVASPDGSVSVFARNPTDGKLTFVEVLKDGVEDSAGNTVDGLKFAISVVVSPDNQHVYVTGRDDDAVAVFARNPNDGKLTFVEVLKDSVNGVDGLYKAFSVVVSPDNQHVYVASLGGTVAVFTRNPTDGKLTFVEVLKDGAKDSAGNTVDGLKFADSVVVSPDGMHVYAAGYFDNAVAVFTRNPTDGKLTFVEIKKDGDTQGPLTIDGLDGAESVKVSPDNQNVYVTGSNDNAIAVFALRQSPTSPESSVTIPRNTAYQFQLTDFTFAQAEGEGATFTGLKVLTTPSVGSLTCSGLPMITNTTCPDLTQLVFTPLANTSGSSYTSFTFQGLYSSSVYSSDLITYTMLINVFTVNNKPTGSDKTISMTVDTNYHFYPDDFGFNDLDTGDNFGGIKVITPPQKGSLMCYDIYASAGDCTGKGWGVFAKWDLSFTPAAHEFGNPYTTFAFQVTDSNGADSAATYTMTINVNLAEPTPTITPTAEPTVTPTAEPTVMATPTSEVDNLFRSYLPSIVR